MKFQDKEITMAEYIEILESIVVDMLENASEQDIAADTGLSEERVAEIYGQARAIINDYSKKHGV
jgi:ParB-like chromosome segregation protein Spo0J